MNDMSSVIVPKSDQINADDLQGRTMDITITDVQIRGGQEQPVSLFFAESDKAFRPCKSMCRVLVQGWGLDAKQYTGKSLRLYCDPSVKFGPLAVGGIRISHMSHLDGPMTMALTATKGVKKAYKVMPLVAEQKAEALTLDQARSDLEFAADLDALKVVWSRKTMAPFRERLQATLDARKAELAGEGRDQSQTGDHHDDTDPDHPARKTADDLIHRCTGAKRESDLVAIDAVLAGHRAAMSDALVLEVESAVSDARALL